MTDSSMDFMRRALESLEPTDQLLLILTRVEGLRVNEVAEVLETTPESSAQMLERAESELSRRLSGQDPNETGGAATCGG